MQLYIRQSFVSKVTRTLLQCKRPISVVAKKVHFFYSLIFIDMVGVFIVSFRHSHFFLSHFLTARLFSKTKLKEGLFFSTFEFNSIITSTFYLLFCLKMDIFCFFSYFCSQLGIKKSSPLD